MNHQIAGGQIGEGAELLPVGGAGFLPGSGLFLDFPPAEKLALGENGQMAQGILHAIGQAAVGEQNLSGTRQGGQGNTDKRGQVFAPEHFLQKLRPPPGAAEHQRAEFLLLVVLQIGSGGVQIAAVTRQLLGGHGIQLLGRAILRIGGSAEGIEEQNRLVFQPGAEILPLAHIVAKLPGHQTGLQEAVQLHPHLVTTASGGTVQARLVTEHHQGIFRNVVGSGGHFRINQSHIPVGSRIVQVIFVFL